ncbi:estradiol 17-beta-dehydrogenase 8-like [Melitaea cinxia]|uniref:estradiol 17-beta-dehydrogenase 8-like n=1 Tax=Melitaea cinxia TaxID=113334 RepID=UPI001E2714A9|nr:estradiol 17-beta-dehydrogenase 8-like [Melitaea cinxia]
MDFKKKVVIITGASSGIGAQSAIAFSKAGAQVVMIGRNETKLREVASKCTNPLVIRADIAIDDDAKRIINETIKTFGQLDVLVNNAGLSNSLGSILEGDLMKSYDSIMSVNLRAVVYLTNLAAPHLIKSKGNIINISSVAGYLSPFSPQAISYCVSKAAVNHFTVCAAVELGAHGVRVNGICPGPVRTDFIANANYKSSWDHYTKYTVLGRVSEPDEIADLIMFLASNKAKGITGSNYVSDNGVMIKRV